MIETQPAGSPVISVIIPAFNRAEMLMDAVNSVTRQGRTDTEVVVVDDGSTENLASAIQSVFGTILYVRQQRLGPSAARNTGIRHASGRYLVFLDSDDMLLPGSLDVLCSYLATHAEIDIAYGDAIFLWPDGATGPVDPPFVAFGQTEQLELRKYLLSRNLFAIGAAMVRRDALLPPLTFDELLPLGEDWDFWRRLAFSGHAFGCTRERVAVIRRHSGNTNIVSRQLVDKWSYHIMANTVALDLDRNLPAEIRQVYRSSVLTIVFRFKGARAGLHGILGIVAPDGRLSSRGARLLAITLARGLVTCVWAVLARLRSRSVFS